ncbi:MAG: AraC family transcriptional regulator [Chlorobium sp.]|nr:AraC family transcriptional regulator [Chlorobium sp.]
MYFKAYGDIADEAETVRITMQGRDDMGLFKFGGIKSAQEVLRKKIARLTVEGCLQTTAIPELSLYRREAPSEPASYFHGPSICLIAQGAKQVILGDEVYGYDANHFLITSVGMPVIAQVIEASKGCPYLGLTLRLDFKVMAQMIMDNNLPLPKAPSSGRGIAVSEVSTTLIEAFMRLIDLLDEPADISILSPLVQREIYYRLLVGDQGLRLRQILETGSQSHQIARAVEWLKENFTRPLRIDDLASYTSMSTSSFHHHFRALTAMSPLQFQKCLRLQEARRLMLTDHLDAATASFHVGYESPSQFSREYRRLFGAPPMRDLRNFHQIATGRI